MKKWPIYILLFSALVFFITIFGSKMYESNEEKNKNPSFANERVIDLHKSEQKNLDSVKEFKKDITEFSLSSLFVKNGAVSIDSDVSSYDDAGERRLHHADQAYNAIKDQIFVPNGAKIIVRENDNQILVMFDSQLPEGSLGSHYAAKVFLDSKTGEVINVISAP
ncbi:hypothetical protein QSV34_08570 [Porticoccus sp. W117]|uniref:hypothetical protein n=1 Tax=Porticoccus sp. W117 TaxID=3054777 RepID=UPI002599E002|nr:hypothetical protein [Porticoccus sp. W117]MDM3871407.1 hypothetical protein [Porticoccus sp. W117]